MWGCLLEVTGLIFGDLTIDRSNAGFVSTGYFTETSRVDYISMLGDINNKGEEEKVRNEVKQGVVEDSPN